MASPWAIPPPNPYGEKPIKPPVSPGGPIFGANPYATQTAMYENSTFDYPIQTLSPEHLRAQNFDAQRQGALRSVGAGVQSGTATGMTALASAGGLGAADRMALEAQGQRQKVNLSQGALSPYDQMQAQNMYDTQKFNVGQEQQATDYNTQILNQRARDIAVEQEKKATNLYQQRLQEALLERQLDAAREIANKQGV